jgi:hypothetical protein
MTGKFCTTILEARDPQLLVRHAFLVMPLKTPVAKSLTSHLCEFLAKLDEGGSWSLPVQQVDPRDVSTATVVLEAALQMQILCVFHECLFPDVACSLERRNTDFTLRPWLFGVRLVFGKNPNRIKEQRSLSRYSH